MVLRNEDGTETAFVASGERLTVAAGATDAAPDEAGLLHPSLREGDVIATLDGCPDPTYGDMYRMMCRGEKLVLEVASSSAGRDDAGGDGRDSSGDASLSAATCETATEGTGKSSPREAFLIDLGTAGSNAATVLRVSRNDDGGGTAVLRSQTWSRTLQGTGAGVAAPSAAGEEEEEEEEEK